MGDKAVLDSGAMVVTGDVTLTIPNLGLEIFVEFRPGTTGSGGMPTAKRIHLVIGVDLSTGWVGDAPGHMGINSSGVPPILFTYNVGSSREGSAILTWTITEF
jgi:hypothetical protein